MSKRLFAAAALLLCAAAFVSAAEAQEVYFAKYRPQCVIGRPQTIKIRDATTAVNCAGGPGAGGGEFETTCDCVLGTWKLHGPAAIDTPADEECFTWESSSSAPEWQTCSSGGGSGTVTSIAVAAPAQFSLTGSPVTTSGTITLAWVSQTANTVLAGPTGGGSAAPTFRALVAADLPAHMIFDIGDDGGNDSTALAEISTLNDEYGAMPYAGSNEAQIDFSKIPPYQQYDPNRPPSSCGTGGVCDEFTNGATISFTFQNQGSATATAVRDGILLETPAGATGTPGYCFTGPNGSTTDWTFHARLSMGSATSFNQAGIIIIATGTQATPTLVYENELFRSSSTPFAFVGTRSLTSWTSAATLVGSDIVTPIGAVFLSIDYVSSTKKLTFSHSVDGYVYYSGSNVTLGAHPTTNFCIYTTSSNATWPVSTFFHFIRLRTDANRSIPGE